MIIKLGMETFMLPAENNCKPTEEFSISKIFDGMPPEDAYAKLDTPKLIKVEMKINWKAEVKKEGQVTQGPKKSRDFSINSATKVRKDHRGKRMWLPQGRPHED